MIGAATGHTTPARREVFVRFILPETHPDSGLNDGPFRLAYKLGKDPKVREEDRRALAELLDWFEKHLAKPPRFSRSRSKGSYRRRTRGIAWFRDTALECLTRMHDLARILEAHGCRVTQISESRVGYVVYEDENQVIAEPFADTRTR
jgi:hypothetical protein